MPTFEDVLHATFTADQRKNLAKSGAAMPHGGFPIRNASDLQNAILAIGRAGGPNGTEKDRNAARRHCIDRAKALGLSDKIPTTWNSDGTLKHSFVQNNIDSVLEHIGVKEVPMVNTTAAIMALPAPLESIRLIGDEDKHSTLLFFGETSTLPDGSKDVLVEAVKSACDMLFPFSEWVRDISRLGTENPPALVAMLSNKNLGQVRDLFSMNPFVKGYLANTPQFPSFTPHVTLGHPDFVDEVILRNLASQLTRVNFDRLAVWWNDERIECPLVFDGEVQDGAMAMSEAIGKFIEHHGIKGQKWGVRRATNSSTGLVARTASADQIHADRIASKLKSGGTGALSNKDLQDFTTRIQREQEFNRAHANAEALKAQKGQNVVTRFLKNQGTRQFTRVADKAIDLAVEKALESTGIKLSGGKLSALKATDAKSKSPFGDNLQELSGRLKPKKK